MLQAIWVHGNSVVPQRTIKAEPVGTDGPLTDIPGVPGSGMLGFREGFGATFRGKDNHSNWFHFSLPTPVFHGGRSSNILRVFVLYFTDPQVSVTDVHVWDGPNQIFRSEPLHGTSGSHVNRLQDNITRWHMSSQPAVKWGIAISVQVRFNDPGIIRFVSAGADFDGG